MRQIAYRPAANSFLRVTRNVNYGVLTSTSAANGFYGINFQINSVGDVSSFAAIFDLYRIAKVDIIIRPMSQPMLPGSTASYANMFVAVDYDDSNAPASQQEVLDYANCKILSPGQGTTLSITPRVAVGAYNGSLNPALSQPSPWIDMTYTTVQHYGLKICVQQSTSTNVTNWYLFLRYHLEFKNSR